MFKINWFYIFVNWKFQGSLSLIIDIELTDTLFNIIVVILVPLPSLINPFLMIFNSVSERNQQKKLEKSKEKDELISKIIKEQRNICK